MSIKEVFYCSFGNLGHWRWPDHGIKPASRILALEALGLRYEDVFECPPPSSSIWCYLIITQPEWNLVWFLFICIIHDSTGKPSVDFQNAAKRALWSMDGPSCISKLRFWLIKDATVHMGLCCFLLVFFWGGKQTDRSLHTPLTTAAASLSCSSSPKHVGTFPTPACAGAFSWHQLPCVL